jgi:hypothetical protein
MSVCQVCQREMTKADSCIRVAVKIRNANARVVKSLDPIRFGDERRYPGVVTELRKAASSDSSSTPSSCSLNSPSPLRLGRWSTEIALEQLQNCSRAATLCL